MLQLEDGTVYVVDDAQCDPDEDGCEPGTSTSNDTADTSAGDQGGDGGSDDGVDDDDAGGTGGGVSAGGDALPPYIAEEDGCGCASAPSPLGGGAFVLTMLGLRRRRD